MARRTQQRPPNRTTTERECPVCGVTHLSYRRVTCSKLCYNTLVRSQSGSSSNKVNNDFLPPDAEENQGRGFWVPSPDEIDAGKQARRTLNEAAMREQRLSR